MQPLTERGLGARQRLDGRRVGAIARQRAMTPGIGVEPLPDVLRRFTRARRDLYGG